MKSARVVLRIIGGVSIVTAVLGLLYNSCSIGVDFSGRPHAMETPYFYEAFYTMSLICVACYLLLAFFGIQFLRLQDSYVLWFSMLLAFEVVYTFSIGFLWLVPSIGRSVGAATGVANGGMTAQLLILFPLWAIPLSIWASRRVHCEVSEA